MARICVVTPCFNEQDNVDELHARLAAMFARMPQHDFEHLFIDNASTDQTVARIKRLIEKDSRVQLIVNARNFGHIRSPFHGVLQAYGDAVAVMASDLQDPPEMLPELVSEWEKGFAIVKAVRSSSDEGFPMAWIRSLFYWLIAKLTRVHLTKNYTGSGLYDRRVIEILREIGDPYPYFRGLVSEIGLEHATVVFHQHQRTRGISANNLYTLYDMALLGITKHSRVPLRLMTFIGFVAAGVSTCLGMYFFVRKLMYWDQFEMGQAPLILGVFFTFSLQMMFMGILGEYVGNNFLQLQRLPLVVEKARINIPASWGDKVPNAIAPNTSVSTSRDDVPPVP